MKYLLLIVSGLRRKPLRTLLTAVAIAVAFVLFGVMHGVIAGFDSALDQLSDTRLRVMNRASLLQPLPIAHLERIRTVDGVQDVSHATIMGAFYQEPSNGLAAAGVDMESFLAVFSELRVPQAQREALLRTRTGALVGHELAAKYGWKVGDVVPLGSLLWTRADGTPTWSVEVTAIANGEPGDEELFAGELYLHYAYLDEARAHDKGTTHQFIVTVADAATRDRVAQQIDAVFANSAHETTTLDDRQYLRAQVAQVGDVRLFVNSILGAVLFTLLFLTGTAMMQSMRERVRELGVLKALGFTDGAVFALILAEAAVLCVVAAAVGLALAGGVFPSVFAALGVQGAGLGGDVYARGVVSALVLAVAVAIWPALRARRLEIAAAVSGR
jgi:putative ABC transport system permease protein